MKINDMRGWCVAILAVFLAVSPALAEKKKDGDTLTIDIEGEDGTNLSLSISGDLAHGIITGLAQGDYECDVTDDRDVLAMLQHLDKHGEGSNYKLKKDDGEVIHAKRRDGKWIMTVKNPGEKDAQIVLPWADAECKLGRKVEGFDPKGLEFKVEQEGMLRVAVE